MSVLDDFLKTYQKAQQFDPSLCFLINKSDNQNFVAYSCQLTDGKFPAEKPVKKYWQTWEELDQDHNPTRYELTSIEKKLAYGVNYTTISQDQVKLTVNAYKKLPITLSHRDGVINCQLHFSGMDYYLLGIYVHLPEKPSSREKIKPKGITLVVKLPLSNPENGGDLELSPPFTIYIDAKTSLD